MFKNFQIKFSNTTLINCSQGPSGYVLIWASAPSNICFLPNSKLIFVPNGKKRPLLSTSRGVGEAGGEFSGQARGHCVRNGSVFIMFYTLTPKTKQFYARTQSIKPKTKKNFYEQTQKIFIF